MRKMKFIFIMFLLSLAAVIIAGCGGGVIDSPEMSKGAISGQVTLEGQSVHSGAAVTIDGWPLLYARTTTDGAYSITDIPAGTYKVIARKNGFVTASEGSVEVTSLKATSGINFYLIPVNPPEPPF